MNETATSLDRLHDLVMPPGVPWWPPAPGWYVVAVAAAVLLMLALIHLWLRWKANAYRREALGALDTSVDLSTIAELLRRTALAFTPRETIARLSGQRWTDWLDARLHTPMPATVRTLLAAGPYAPSTAPQDCQPLRDYAREWIAHHRQALPPSPSDK